MAALQQRNSFLACGKPKVPFSTSLGMTESQSPDDTKLDGPMVRLCMRRLPVFPGKAGEGPCWSSPSAVWLLVPSAQRGSFPKLSALSPSTFTRRPFLGIQSSSTCQMRSCLGLLSFPASHLNIPRVPPFPGEGVQHLQRHPEGGVPGGRAAGPLLPGVQG